MKNFSIDIVKDNNYYLKSPFSGELVLFYVDDNDHVEKDQIIGVLRTDYGYIDIVSDYSGSIVKVNVKLNDAIEKWHDILVVDVSEENHSEDYNIIYAFQHEAFPKFIYEDTAKVLTGIAHEEGQFIHYLFEKFYENYNLDIPFNSEDFNISEALVDKDIVLIGIDWPELSSPLLTLRSYILIDTVKESVGYFACEKSLDDKFEIFFIIPVENELKRFSYGNVTGDLALERQKVVNSFISYLNPKKKEKVID